MSNIKRLYFYVVAFAGLMVSAAGATVLLGPLLDRLLGGTVLIGNATTSTSLGLAMLITGVPLWLIHWATAQRYARLGPAETGSALRKLYLNAVLFISAAVAFVAAFDILAWVLGATRGPLSGDWLARLLVWGSLWTFHWSVESREGQPSPAARTLRRWYLYPTAGYSLVVLAISVGMLLHVFLARLYEAVFPAAILNTPPLWGQDAREAVARLLAGGAWWAFHWLYAARGDRGSVLRQVYLSLFAVLGGIATFLGTLTFMLYQTLRFLVGGVTTAATVHFDFLTDTVPPLLVGAALWAYHGSVVREEAGVTPQRAQGAARAYRYILAAAGLVAVSAAITVLVPILLGALIASVRGNLGSARWWQDPASAALALLVVGFPLWLAMWTSVQRTAEAGGVAERAALPRRLFLYAVLAAGAIVILGNLSFALFRVLEGITQANLSIRVLQDIKFSVGMVLAAALFLTYYWSVLREDQRVGAEAEERRKRVLLLAPEGSSDLTRQLEEVLGTRPRVLGTLTTPTGAITLSAEQAQALASEVAAAPGDSVLLVVEDGRVQVYGYR